MRLPPEALDEERSRSRELFKLSEAWLQGLDREAIVDLGASAGFIPVIAASIPEVTNVTRSCSEDLRRFEQNQNDENAKEELVHTLRWELGETLLRYISLERPSGVTWVVALQTLSDLGSTELSDAALQPSSINGLHKLSTQLKALGEAARDLEMTVRQRSDLPNVGLRLRKYYLSSLETLAAAERVLMKIE